mgnify:CR=1 FL=1
MKTLIYCIVIFICFLGCNSQKKEKAQYREDTDSIYNKYIGKEIKLFLEDINFKEYKKLTIMDSKPGKASSLWVHYDNNIDIELFPDKFKHMKSFDPNFRWDIEQFKLENIQTIVVYNKSSVVKFFGNSQPNGYTK